MKRRNYSIIGFLILSLGVLYYTFRDSLPPRTPKKIARNISGLSITGDYRVLSFNEEWSDFTGDGSLTVEIELESDKIDNLIQECKKSGYQALPFKDLPSVLDPGLFLKDSDGFYKIRTHNKRATAFDISVLDTKYKRLRVYVFVL